jgi:hypothetical protein
VQEKNAARGHPVEIVEPGRDCKVHVVTRAGIHSAHERDDARSVTPLRDDAG